MSSQPNAPVAGAMRDVISFDRLPWIRPLVAAHAAHFASVASFFTGNPADSAAWGDVIGRVQRAHTDHTAIHDIVSAQLARRQAPAAAVTAASALADPRAVAVVTGQQAGLFGGPLYTLLKALTTIQLARKVRDEHGVPTVPVFWVDGEDHDFAEIRSAAVLDRDYALHEVSLPEPIGAGTLPVAALSLDQDITTVLDALEQCLAPTEFTSVVVDSLRRHYRPGVSISGAFAGWIEEVLGGEGLVVFEAADPRAKPLVASLFTREFTHPCQTALSARATGAEMAAHGHAAQIEPGEDVVCVFYMDATGRRPIRHRDGRFLIADEFRDAASLAAEATAHPERFSPNVLLRPLVQDTLFPTACYVAGPSELAYQAQLRDAYRASGLPQPLLASRASATILDSAAAKFLDRHALPLEALQPQDESALNRLLAAQLPAELDELFAQLDAAVTDGTARLKPVVATVDPTLAGAVDTTLERVRDTVKNLQGKILQASKKKDETLKRQFMRTRALAFPAGHPQERLLSIAFFLNRYGPALPLRLIDTLPSLPTAHYVITP
ncbi:MAG: bacillithiol biosynthesis cysteine-adding enzyme BshC [Acidobacteriota bacterium]